MWGQTFLKLNSWHLTDRTRLNKTIVINCKLIEQTNSCTSGNDITNKCLKIKQNTFYFCTMTVSTQWLRNACIHNDCTHTVTAQCLCTMTCTIPVYIMTIRTQWLCNACVHNNCTHTITGEWLVQCLCTQWPYALYCPKIKPRFHRNTTVEFKILFVWHCAWKALNF